MTRIVGCDPGQSGAIAVLDEYGASVQPFKDMTDKDIFDYLVGLSPVSMAWLEAVHSMPAQGVSSSFAFGVSYGSLRMALVASGTPFTTVSPTKWKAAMGLRREKGETTTHYKNRSKQLCQELYPGVKATHAVSEALLLAEYGRRQG